MRQKRRSYRGQDDDEDAIGEDLAAVHERLDDLTRHLERIAQSSANAGPRVAAPSQAEQRTPDRVADALARLDRRLDQVINETRAAETERQARFAAPQPQPTFAPSFAPPPAQSYSPPPPQPQPSRGPANWAAQISARQRALDGGVPAAATAPPPAPAAAPQWGAGADIAGLEQQLRQINSQISSLHHPYENALTALRGDLAEIGRALTEAMPRRAIEPLEAEVRALSERLDKTRQAGADGASLAALERGLAEVRDALRGLTPAESLVGFEDAVRALSQKIDQIAGAAHSNQDPLAFKQLEQAVVSLRGVVSNVASDGALAQLAAEVHAIGSQFERAAADSSTEALTKLESRIASLMESGRAVPPELEGSIRALSERLDRMQLSQGDQLALGALEDRIAKLSEKLDASDARLGHLDAIERGLADLLVHLEENRNGGPRGLRAQTPAETTRTESAPAEQPSAAPAAAPNMPAAAPLSPLDMIPDMPAPTAPMFQPPVEYAPPAHQPIADLPAHAAPAIVPTQPAPEPQRRPMARPMPRAPERPPIDPNLPPDTPLEPGSGIPRSKPGSAAARIAASEAALGGMRPTTPESGGKSAAIAAARNAAKAAYLDTPVKVPKSLNDSVDGEPRRSWFKRSAKKAAKNAPEIALQPMPQPAAQAPYPAYDDMADAPPSRGRRVLRFFKKLLIAASVAIIVLGAVQTALEFLLPDQGSKPPATQAPNANAPKTNAPSGSQRSLPPATAPSRPMPTPQGSLPMPAPMPQGSLPAAPAADTSPTGQIGGGASFFDPSAMFAPRPPHNEVTGSISRQPLPPRPPANPPAGHSQSDTAVAATTTTTTTSLTLSDAAAANNPAAEYEMGVRYAEGRGVPQSFYEAVRWLGRSANAGFVPAQFRLASLNEKGEGMKKDVQAARRLYMAAASKGHAKAMHNLAVLYAEGVDGKPDYKVASQWFRKAASYGVTDSQYNLAILYARGIGMPANLAESYKWFALAASNGDSDASKKRDEVAARLDQKTLTAAKLAVQAFVPEREPDEATNLRAPPGGWDRQPAMPAKPRRRAPASTAR